MTPVMFKGLLCWPFRDKKNTYCVSSEITLYFTVVMFSSPFTECKIYTVYDETYLVTSNIDIQLTRKYF